jgi:DNA invertase Pin-like site-specific DNA recombinase
MLRQSLMGSPHARSGSTWAGRYDPNDRVGRLLFNVLAMVAEFDPDLLRLRTREGMKVAKAKGRLRGKKPKLNPRQAADQRKRLRRVRVVLVEPPIGIEPMTYSLRVNRSGRLS